MSDDATRAVLGVLLPGFSGTTPPGWLLEAARDGLAGVVLFGHNTPDVATTARLTGALHDAAPDLLVTVDEEGGDVTRLEAAQGSSVPGPRALGDVDDALLTGDVAEALGRVLTAAGIDIDLAPVLDVDIPGNPVIGTRAFGDDPVLVARHGVELVRGLHRGGVGACAKHFPGHGSTTVDSHVGLPVVTVSLETLRGRDLVPFVAAFDELDTLMVAHVVVPELGPGPASLEPATVALARELGFDGPVITDALDMRAVSDGVHVGEAAVRAVEAGADLLCLGTTVARDDESLFRDALQALLAAVQDGRISIDRLTQSAARTRRTVTAVRARRRLSGVEPGPDSAVAELDALAEVGSRAARAAVRFADRAAEPITTAPLVVDLRVRYDHAAGNRLAHVPRALAARWPDTQVHPADGANVPEPSRRPLVVVTHEAPVAGQADRMAALADRWPALVIVHTGPSSAVGPWLEASGAPDATPVVLTHGSGRATAEAAARLLAGETA